MKRIFCSPPAKFPVDRWSKADKRLLAAVDRRDVGKLAAMLKGSTVVSKLDAEGRSPFHVAACRGYTDCLDLLLSCRVDLEARDFEGRTALQTAVRNSHPDCVRSLLKHKASVDTLDAQGGTALHHAAISGSVVSANLLCDYGACTNTPDREGTTPLMLAARLGHADICQLLIGRGADIDVTDSKHRTALILACASDCPEVAELLLMAGADAGVTDSSGHDACHYAQRCKSSRLRSLMQTAEPGQSVENHCQQDPADAEGGPRTTTPSEAAAPQGCRGRDRSHGQDEAAQLRQDLDRETAERQELAGGHERTRRWLVHRLTALLGAPEEGDRREEEEEEEEEGTEWAEVDLLLDQAEERVGALRAELEKSEAERRRLEEEDSRSGGAEGEAEEGPGAGGQQEEEEGDLERLRVERDRLAEERSLAERRFVELEGHLDNVRALMSQYRLRKCSQSRQIDELEIQVLDLTGNNVELSGLVRRLQEEIQGKEPGMALPATPERAGHSPGTLAERCASLRTANASLARQNERLEEEAAKLRAEASEASEERAFRSGLVLQLREAECGLADLQLEAEQLRAENGRLRQAGRPDGSHHQEEEEEEEEARLREGLQRELGEARRELDAERQERDTEGRLREQNQAVAANQLEELRARCQTLDRRLQGEMESHSASCIEREDL
ncbi:ankyrin repeat domain-containing protein 35-like, partial [Scyliorhinus canicula]|uniref:ankyrin repeat domain-containing protein 35-like n=1 Tax=Scyliorhinus canicula TaxID=7830 RepID=UPI0018F44CA4